jgi:hypothetical protein
MTDWISVKDRLPELAHALDVSPNVIGVYNGKLGIFCIYSDGDGWAWCRANYGLQDLATADCEFDDDYEVTHWMPLPELPKEMIEK